MRTFPGHTGFVESLAFSADGRTLASGSADGTVRLWDVISGKALSKVQLSGSDQIGAVAFSPDGRWLGIGDYRGHVRVCQLADMSHHLDWYDRGRIVGLAFAPGGEWLAWASYDGVVMCRFPGGELIPLADRFPKPFCLVVAPDGGTIAVGHQSAQFTLWDVKTRQPRSLTHGKERGCWNLAYAPDGRTLAMALGEGVQLWDPIRGRLIGELDGHRDVVSGVAYSADGRRLATCGWDDSVRVYDVDNGLAPRLLETYDWKVGRLFTVAFSPDGTLAAVGGDCGDYLLAWDVE
jgi:WD40 repeat protein